MQAFKIWPIEWPVGYSALARHGSISTEELVRTCSSRPTRVASRALWFPQSRNRGRNRGIGRLKQNLLFNVGYRRIWHNFTEMLFLCGRERAGHRPPPHRLSSPIKTLQAWRSGCPQLRLCRWKSWETWHLPLSTEPSSSWTTFMCQVNCCFAKKQTWES